MIGQHYLEHYIKSEHYLDKKKKKRKIDFDKKNNFDMILNELILINIKTSFTQEFRILHKIELHHNCLNAG